MAARLYANENFHRGVVNILRELGHDVLTTLEAGRANRKIPDEEVVAFAKEESRAVLTFNRRHFIRLHESLNGDHWGIIVCTMDPDLRALAHRIDAQIQSAGTLHGKMLQVHRPTK
jgi:hypothetical protein